MRISNYLSEKIKILSFMLTVLIVVLHANMANLCTGGGSFLQEVMTVEVTRIAVPIFFLISGFLFFYNYQNTWSDYQRKLCARTHSLLIPYALFLLCGSFVMFVLGPVYTIEALWGIGFHSTLLNKAMHKDSLPIRSKIGKVRQNHIFLYHLIGKILLCSIMNI